MSFIFSNSIHLLAGQVDMTDIEGLFQQVFMYDRQKFGAWQQKTYDDHASLSFM